MRVLMTVVVFLNGGFFLYAQTPEAPVSVTVEVRDAQNNAVSTQLYPFSLITCGQVKPPTPIVPPLNPTTVYWEDPSNIALACLTRIENQLKPIPSGGGFTVWLRANGPTLVSLYSIPSNRFGLQALGLPPTPIAPATLSGVRIR